MPDVIRVERLAKRLGNKEVLKEVSLAVKASEVMALVGPNGAGKTTTLRNILGTLCPDAGSVELLGRNPYLDQEVLCEVGCVLETDGLYSGLTVLDNLRLYAEIMGTSRANVDSWMRRLGIWDYRERKAGTLSRGTKQRAALARALLHSPRVLVLDEPLSGLDPEAQQEVTNTIRLAAGDGVGVLLSSHDLDKVEKVADNVAVMVSGATVAMDTPENLKRSVGTPTLVLRVAAEDSQLAAKALSAWKVDARIGGEHTVLTVKLESEKDSAEVISRVVHCGTRLFSAEVELPSLYDAFVTLCEREKNSEPTQALACTDGQGSPHS